LEAFVADWYASVYLGVRVDYRARLLPRGGIEDVGSLDELDFFPLSLSLGGVFYIYLLRGPGCEGGGGRSITTAWSIAGRIWREF